jgi:hypothetical protein
MTPESFASLVAPLGRRLAQRTTSYGIVDRPSSTTASGLETGVLT